MSNTYVLILIAVMALVTMAIRFAPFILFNGKETPEFINYLGKYLPYSIIAMLVVYCLKGVSLVKGSHGLPELISVAVVAGLHIWKRNTLLSIVAGTLCYMFLMQVVFG